MAPRPVSLARAALTAAVLVALYYTLPLVGRSHTYIVLELVISIAFAPGHDGLADPSHDQSAKPAIRRVQALASTTSLFLLLLAAAYFIMSWQDQATFTEPLSRSDALYLTITVFATVGFGDISAHTQTQQDSWSPARSCWTSSAWAWASRSSPAQCNEEERTDRPTRPAQPGHLQRSGISSPASHRIRSSHARMPRG